MERSSVTQHLLALGKAWILYIAAQTTTTKIKGVRNVGRDSRLAIANLKCLEWNVLECRT